MEAPVSDPEALALAEQLVKNLRSAGWEVPYFSRELSVGSAAGLEILINDFKTAPERAQTLAKALDAIGIPSRAKASPATPEDSLTLVIGPRE
ncbi:MAG: hypothetical protein C0617_03550 [Desulfuromonas sp.]|uniref:hypothetical protein n=1 Tax=Desulfuromonas sp. TaxID=892 RepID=UPI000CA9801A|nr:hypothetical protein [Desulfuromonas sp.]PLX85584.1 MAG: hypothetical protein C0617_03550 [Desulfuromonas sp.]